MLIRFLRFFRGTLEFQVSGKYLERFLNLTARAQIPIWDGKREEQTFYGKTLLENEEQLRQIAEKVQLQWSGSSFNGAPKLRQRYRKRVGIGTGVLLSAALLLFSQQFVWKIEVKGNEQLGSSEVISTAKQLGLKPGVWKHSLDVIRIADQLSVQLDEVSWSAVNLLGTTAEIEIVERVLPPELIDDETPCNVVAKKAGTIVELEVYDGERMVKIGDTIRQGELIASGILQDKKGRTFYEHARARMVVEYTQTEIVELPLSVEGLAATGSPENVYRLFVGSYSLSLPFSSLPNSDEFSTEKGLVESGIYRDAESGEQWFYSIRNRALSVLGLELPITLQLQQYIPAGQAAWSYTPQKARDLAVLKLQQVKRTLENQEIEIVDEELSGIVKNNVFVLTAELICREEVAQEVEIGMIASE